MVKTRKRAGTAESQPEGKRARTNQPESPADESADEPRSFPFPPAPAVPEVYVLKYDVEGVSAIDDNGKNSPSIEVKGIKWYVRVRTETSDRTSNEQQLSIYIYCAEKNLLDVWYADVLSDIKLVNKRDRTRDKTEKFSYRFGNKLLNSGYASFIKLADVLAPARGFIVNDTIQIEASISVLKVHGLPAVIPPFNFSVQTENLSDGTLVVGGKKVYVSKQLLGINSPPFEALFFNRRFKEANQEEITLEEVDYDEFIAMLQQLYNPDAEVNPTNCGIILKLADQFQIKSIMKRAEHFLCTCYQYPDYALASRLRLADQYDLFEAQHAILLKLTKVSDITSMRNQRDYIPISDTTKLLVTDLQLKLAKKEAENKATTTRNAE